MAESRQERSEIVANIEGLISELGADEIRAVCDGITALRADLWRELEATELQVNAEKGVSDEAVRSIGRLYTQYQAAYLSLVACGQDTVPLKEEFWLWTDLFKYVPKELGAGELLFVANNTHRQTILDAHRYIHESQGHGMVRSPQVRGSVGVPAVHEHAGDYLLPEIVNSPTADPSDWFPGVFYDGGAEHDAHGRVREFSPRLTPDVKLGLRKFYEYYFGDNPITKPKATIIKHVRITGLSEWYSNLEPTESVTVVYILTVAGGESVSEEEPDPYRTEVTYNVVHPIWRAVMAPEVVLHGLQK